MVIVLSKIFSVKMTGRPIGVVFAGEETARHALCFFRVGRGARAAGSLKRTVFPD